MKEIKLNNEPPYLDFAKFIDKEVTDKEALKWLHNYFNNSCNFSKDAMVKALLDDHKPTCWIDFVNKNFSDNDILVDTKKIHAFSFERTVYIFHRINSSYVCVNLTNSNHYNREYDSLEKLIQSIFEQKHKVYEFDTQEEFLTWALIITGNCESMISDNVGVFHTLKINCQDGPENCRVKRMIDNYCKGCPIGIRELNNEKENTLGWRLPTKGELNLMYENLQLIKKKDIGGFAEHNYWSSFESNTRNAWYQNFRFGNRCNDNKNSTYKVRAVRAFTAAYPYTIGERTATGYIFDKNGDNYLECALKDEEGFYTWDDAKNLFRGESK